MAESKAAAVESGYKFQYTNFAQQVLFGCGALAQLGQAVERFHRERLLLCASGSARRNGHIAQVQAALDSYVVAIYDRVQPHVQDFQVAEVLDLAEQNRIDAVIGLGGGSPIGMAKAVSLALEEKRRGRPARAMFPTDQPLPRCYAAGDDVDARTEMLLGAHLAGVALATVTMGLHHGLCHVLGGTAGVPHGIANAIVLPHAMRFNARTVAPELAQIAAAMGIVRERRGDAEMAELAAQRAYE